MSVSAKARSSLCRPTRSVPNKIPHLSPLEWASHIISAQPRGSFTGLIMSRNRAVVAPSRWRSDTASAVFSKSLASVRTAWAPDEAFIALEFGHLHLGRTSRNSVRPKFIIARAVIPIFSAKEVSMRIITGPPPGVFFCASRFVGWKSTILTYLKGLCWCSIPE